MKWGDVEENLIKQSRLSNMPLPDAIANRPVLNLGLDLYYIAFLDLTTTRQVGMAEGPISWTSIKDYCIAKDLGEELTEDMFYIIPRLDQTYLKYQSDNMKAK